MTKRTKNQLVVLGKLKKEPNHKYGKSKSEIESDCRRLAADLAPLCQTLGMIYGRSVAELEKMGPLVVPVLVPYKELLLDLEDMTKKWKEWDDSRPDSDKEPC